MKKVCELTGRHYHLFDYVRRSRRRARSSSSWAPAATPSRRPSTTCNAKGEKVGLVKVHLYRPFCVEALRGSDPRHLSRRSPCWTAPRSPAPWASRFTWMSCAALDEAGRTDIKVVGGRYGLGSKEFNPTMVKAVYDNLAQRSAQEPLHRGHQRRRDRHLPAHLGEKIDRRARRHRSAASSTAWAPTVPSAPTRTPSRSSATTPICTRRATSATTPRSPAV